METVRSVAHQVPQGSWLVFRLGRCVLCATVFDVEGIIPRPERFIRFPLMPEHALGAFLFRGRSAAAISLRRRLKLPEGEDTATGPFIVARIRGAPVAFWVDEVKDVIGEADAEWHPIPALLEDTAFERFAVRGGDLIVQTTFAALLESRVDFGTFQAWATREIGAPATPPVDVAPPAAVPPPVAMYRQVADNPPVPAISPASTPRRDGTVTTARKPYFKPTTRLVPRAPVAKPLPGKPAPLRAPATVTKMSVRGGARKETESSAIRYWLAAAGLALVAVAVPVLNGLQPTPARPGPPASVAPVSPRASAEQVTLPAAPDPKPILEQSPLERAEVTLTIHRPGEALAPGGQVHVVVRGDTLWGIAKKYLGNPFQYAELAKYSGIRDPHRIHPGDRIRIELRQRKPPR